jgi:hypothetical protein
MRTLFCVLLFFGAILPAQAQFDGFSSVNAKPALEFQPSYPSPGETVMVSLNDYRSAWGGAEIRWYVNDTEALSAQNKRQLAVAAPDVGSRSTIKAVLNLPSGHSETIAATLEPLYLDLIIEPETHVPIFYDGRALPSVGSTVHVTALLGDTTLLGTNFIYTWRINGSVLGGGPQRGQHKTSFTVPHGSSFVLSLQVNRLDGTTLAQRSLFVPTVAPELNFYEVSTLYGVESMAIKNGFNLIGNSATIVAEPYFLDSKVFNNPSVLEWTVNGDQAEVRGDNPYEVTLERTGAPGMTNLGFHVRSTTLLLQGAQGDIPINI